MGGPDPGLQPGSPWPRLGGRKPEGIRQFPLLVTASVVTSPGLGHSWANVGASAEVQDAVRGAEARKTGGGKERTGSEPP